MQSAHSETAIETIQAWATSDGLLLVTENLFRMLLKGILGAREDDEEEDDDDEDDAMVEKNSQVTGKIVPPVPLDVQKQLLDPFLIVVDEAHRIQNPRSMATQVRLQIDRCQLD